MAVNDSLIRVRLPKSFIKMIDVNRGELSRSAFVRSAIFKRCKFLTTYRMQKKNLDVRKHFPDDVMKTLIQIAHTPWVDEDDED